MKYINKKDIEHLASVIKQDYEIDIDWEGTRYLGLMLDGDYATRKVHLSMPGYIEKNLVRFGHFLPTKPQMQPHPHTIPTYGATVQYAKAIDASPTATKNEEKHIRQVISVLLYNYGQAVNSTILVGLSSLAAAQAKPLKQTLSLAKWLLDYTATNPDAILTYKKATWYLLSTAMPPTSANHQPAAMSVVISSALPILTTHPTMEPSSTYPKYSRPSCPVQLKPNLVTSTSTPVKQSQ